MTKISMLVQNQYDSYRYELPVAIYANHDEALAEADRRNKAMRIYEKEAVHKVLDGLQAEMPPKYRDYYVFDYGTPIAEIDWEEWDRQKVINDEIKNDRWALEYLAHDLNRYMDRVKPENMAEYIDRLLEDECFSVTLIDYNP